MNLEFSSAEHAFREEVQSFVAERLAAHIRHKVRNGIPLSRDDHLQWQRTLHARGWGAPSWPKEFGGPGWSPVQLYIFEEECALGGAPRPISFGLRMLAPVLMAFGTPAQQQRFLPRIMAGEEWWCQGYSEPGAGSDLASLKTSAVRHGDHYRVTGQKTWTTLAQHADWIFCLVRTDVAAKAQRGISFLMIDMKSPGVSLRPIIMLDGGHEINEVWFDEVRVPLDHRVGEENQGWTYAKFLLGHERANIAGIGIAKRELARLKRLAAAEVQHGRPLLADPRFAMRVGQIEIELMALEVTALRVLCAESERRAPGAEASILKIRGTEIQQAISELLLQAAGHAALPLAEPPAGSSRTALPLDLGHDAPLAAQYFNLRKLSIFGGSNEIQKNIIAQAVLGL